MKIKLTKRNIYIGLFTILYLLVGFVSLFHSFAFFGLANDKAMSIMLGCCFEIGQVAVLMSLLTSKKDQGRVTNWLLMCLLTLIQIIGNVFSSYKYMMLHSTENLRYFKEPIFVWTDLPDNITTVIVTYLVGAILPIIALAMTSMVSNYLMETKSEDPYIDKPLIKDDEEIKEDKNDTISKDENETRVEEKSNVDSVEKNGIESTKQKAHFVNLE